VLLSYYLEAFIVDTIGLNTRPYNRTQNTFVNLILVGRTFLARIGRSVDLQPMAPLSKLFLDGFVCIGRPHSRFVLDDTYLFTV
jgi:hypothetical protein